MAAQLLKTWRQEKGKTQNTNKNSQINPLCRLRQYQEISVWVILNYRSKTPTAFALWSDSISEIQSIFARRRKDWSNRRKNSTCWIIEFKLKTPSDAYLSWEFQQSYFCRQVLSKSSLWNLTRTSFEQFVNALWFTYSGKLQWRWYNMKYTLLTACERSP